MFTAILNMLTGRETKTARRRRPTSARPAVDGLELRLAPTSGGMVAAYSGMMTAGTDGVTITNEDDGSGGTDPSSTPDPVIVGDPVLTPPPSTTPDPSLAPTPVVIYT